jgi:D-glycero-alpha-D-manno-heptose-7-phosphate kinase
MIYRSKAPLRIGLAGGGTDVSPYSDLYGGAIPECNYILICLCQYRPLDENVIILQALDRKGRRTF